MCFFIKCQVNMAGGPALSMSKFWDNPNYGQRYFMQIPLQTHTNTPEVHKRSPNFLQGIALRYLLQFLFQGWFNWQIYCSRIRKLQFHSHFKWIVQWPGWINWLVLGVGLSLKEINRSEMLITLVWSSIGLSRNLWLVVFKVGAWVPEPHVTWTEELSI